MDETLIPHKEIKRADVRYDVPIMIEITEEDRLKAKHYFDCDNCMIGTVLRRMGYDKILVGGSYVEIDNHLFHPANISDVYPTTLYGANAVGHQIILYPGNT